MVEYKAKTIVSKEDVHKQLLGLGSNKTEIAQSLQALGIKGRRKEFQCPIGNYLCEVNQETSYWALVFSGGDELVSLDTDNGHLSLTAYPELRSVREFVRAFDAGEFPELVE